MDIEQVMRTCEMCDRTDANFYELVGAVHANLCPKHRTDAHTYISTELPLTEFRIVGLERQMAANDLEAVEKLDANFLDIELEIHRRLKEYIYGKEIK